MDISSNCFPSEEDIKKIPTYRKGNNILKKLGIKLENVENLNDVKEVLMLKYHRNQDQNEEIRETKLYKEYPQIMNKLKALLKKMEKFKNSKRFKDELGEIFKLKENKIETIVKPLKKMIECKKFPILIVGEAKAGKSTFINILLNKDLMPTGMKVCNRIMCEIQNSTEQMVTFSGPDVKSLTLGIEDLTKIKKIIKGKIEEGFVMANFKYPVNFLENYTYLVDSPGIGDTLLLENMTLEYLRENSPALIFVLNSTNCYGLDIKTKTLIEKSKEIFCDTEHSFSNFKSPSGHIFQFEKAIFIINHMDVIINEISSQLELEAFKKKIVNKIKTLWHENIDEKRQIFFISAKKAREWQDNGIVQDVITDIRNCIRRLIVYIYEKNLQFSIKKLDLLCSKFEKKILTKLNNRVDYEYHRLTDRNNDQIICETLQKTLTDMAERKLKIISEIRPKFDAMAENLTEYLKSDSLENRIINSYRSKIDPDIKDIHLLVLIFQKYFENQLFQEITLWEKDSKQMETLYNYLYDSIKKNLNEICNQINASENILNKEYFFQFWNESCETENSNSADEFIDRIEKVFIISTLTMLFPIVALAGVLATPLIISHIFKEKQYNEEQMLLYKNNPETFLKFQSSQIIKKLTSKIIRNFVFNNVEKKCLYLVDKFEKAIENNLVEKTISINSFEIERRDFMEILNSLRLLLNDMETFCSELEIIKINCETVIDPGIFVLPSIYEKVINKETRITECLSTGQFSQLFKNENYKSVVFKAYTKEFNKTNAHFQMLEIDLLRKHPSDFLIRCESALFLKAENKIMIVLESVDCNLYTYLQDNQILILSHETTNNEIQSEALQFLLDISIQISFALKYLFTYEPRMVHPDLTLYSIMVRKTSEISKIKILLGDACCNLSIKSQNKNNQSENFIMGGFTMENVFRLGLIFYQMACFRNYCKIGQMKENCENDLTSLYSFDVLMFVNPSIIKVEELPPLVPTGYRELIDKCVSQKPEYRPTITDIVKDLEDINNTIKGFIGVSNSIQASSTFEDHLSDEI